MRCLVVVSSLSLAGLCNAYIPPAATSRTSLKAATVGAEMPSSLSARGTLKQPLSYRVADKVVGTLFSIDPIFNFLSSKARKTMVKRADSIGVSWSGLVDDYKKNFEEVERDYESVYRERVILPDYYVKPFHAYKEGNLCWEAAMEVEAAAYSVHSPIYTDNSNLEKEGDAKLRGYFHDKMMEVLVEKGFKPKTIVDIGCSTGLSTLKLQTTFPEAEILGLDLSPYMLAVAKYNLRSRPELQKAKGHVDYVHAAGESTGLPDSCVDMVSVCLVHHELPVSASRNMFREAYRILKPGGAITFMDMNPEAPAFQRIVTNPMLFALFKSTEPWLQDYVSLELTRELQGAGFKGIETKSNSPRHRTVVAFVDK